MLLQAHLKLALARLRRIPGVWLALLAAGALGPALLAFERQAPISDHSRPELMPWLSLAGLVGSLLGHTLVRGTEHARRGAQPTPLGDFLLIAVPALSVVCAALLSLQATGHTTPWLSAIAATVHLAALTTLLYPLGPLALIATTWVLPPLVQNVDLAPVLPYAQSGAPVAATLAFATALLVLSTLRPHAIRSTR